MTFRTLGKVLKRGGISLTVEPCCKACAWRKWRKRQTLPFVFVVRNRPEIWFWSGSETEELGHKLYSILGNSVHWSNRITDPMIIKTAQREPLELGNA